MSAPTSRWLEQQRRDRGLPVARGLVAAGALAGLAITLPVAIGGGGGLRALAHDAFTGHASLGSAALVLLRACVVPLVSAALGAWVAGAVHVRVIGRGGGGAPGGRQATAGALIVLAIGAALIIAHARDALDTDAPSAIASKLALQLAVVAALVGVAAGVAALARARAERDEAFARSADPDAARETTRREARRRA